MDNSLFYSARQVTGDEARDARTRRVEGNGTPYLWVPGLTRLEAVRVGRLELPLIERLEYPVDAAASRTREEEVPVVMLAEDEHGEQILLRSIRSNDGKWQHGQPVFVTGDWQDEERPRRGARGA